MHGGGVNPARLAVALTSCTSITLTFTSGNTNIPTVMIGEKVEDMIRRDTRARA
jgi:hypothetical protein